jgi:hypothetical protein
VLLTGRIPTMVHDNGLQTFALHSDDELAGPTIQALNDEVTTVSEAAPVEQEKLDPETAARRYLEQMIAVQRYRPSPMTAWAASTAPSAPRRYQSSSSCLCLPLPGPGSPPRPWAT